MKKTTTESLEEKLYGALPSLLNEPEVARSFSMADVVERLVSEGIFDARPTVVREFDEIVNPRRGERGAEKHYREYGQGRVFALRLFLALRLLGFSKKEIEQFWGLYQQTVAETWAMFPETSNPLYILKEKMNVADPDTKRKLLRYQNQCEQLRQFKKVVYRRTEQLQELIGKTQNWLSEIVNQFEPYTSNIANTLAKEKEHVAH